MLPIEATPLLAALAPHFTGPICRHFALLMAAAIIARGRRTVANLPHALGRLAPGYRTDYRRVLSRAPGRACGSAAPWQATSRAISARTTR